MYNIAHIDSSGYPTNEVSADEIAAEVKAFNPVTNSGKIVGCEVGSTSPMTSAEYIAQSILSVNELITAGATYPDMSICIELLNVSTSTYPMVTFGSGYAFSICNNAVGLISQTTDTRYVKKSISNLGAGFVGVLYDSSNYDLETVIENGTVGTLETKEAANIKASSSQDYYNKVLFGEHMYDTNKHTKFSALAIGHGMSVIQLNAFKTSLHTLLNVLNG